MVTLDILEFVAVGAPIGVPLSVLMGCPDLKRSTTWRAKADIRVEANPCYYRLALGRTREITAPKSPGVFRQIHNPMESRGLLSDRDATCIVELEQKMEHYCREDTSKPPKGTWTLEERQIEVSSRSRLALADSHVGFRPLQRGG